MAKKRYKVTFSVDYDIDVEVDDEIINDEWVKHFQRYFHDLDDEETPQKSVATNLAIYHAEHGQDGSLIEGYGHITRNGELAYFERQDNEAAPGMNIIPIQDEFIPWNISVEEVNEQEGQP